MGARALVAVERESGSYDLHYSHWGAADLRLAQRLERGVALGRMPDSPVDPAPLATDLPRSAVFERVDLLLHEALYIVSTGLAVATYLPLSFALDPTTQSADGPSGALVRVRPRTPSDPTAVRWWHRGAREALAAAAADGHLGDGAARRYLADGVREAFPDREVVVR